MPAPAAPPPASLAEEVELAPQVVLEMLRRRPRAASQCARARTACTSEFSCRPQTSRARRLSARRTPHTPCALCATATNFCLNRRREQELVVVLVELRSLVVARSASLAWAAAARAPAWRPPARAPSCSARGRSPARARRRRSGTSHSWARAAARARRCCAAPATRAARRASAAADCSADWPPRPPAAAAAAAETHSRRPTRSCRRRAPAPR